MSVRKRTWSDARGAEKSAWVVDYVDTAGKRRLKTFARKKEADAFSATANVEVREGVHVADSATVTIAKAGELWLTTGDRAGLERSTMNQRKRHLEMHINPFIGNLLLSKVTVPGVRDFEDTLRDNGRSPAMIRKVLGSLGSIFADAVERGLTIRNPIRDVRRRRGSSEARSQKRHRGRLEVGRDIPAPTEIKSFIAALDDHWRPFFLTAIFTGMRSSELRGLRWQDVDLKRSEIRVTQRVDEFGAIGPPKSEAGARTIPIPPLVANALKELRLRQKKGTEIVFANPEGKPRTHTNAINKGLIPAMKRAGLVVAGTDAADHRAKYSGLHALRHFYASWCINRKEDGGLGLPAKAVQERLGHASIVMTMDVYGHLFPRGDDGKELEHAANSLLI